MPATVWQHRPHQVNGVLLLSLYEQGSIDVSGIDQVLLWTKVFVLQGLMNGWSAVAICCGGVGSFYMGNQVRLLGSADFGERESKNLDWAYIFVKSQFQKLS